MPLLSLTLLQIKHFLHLGGLTHSLQHGLFTVIAVAMVDPLHSLVMGILDTVVHYHID